MLQMDLPAYFNSALAVFESSTTEHRSQLSQCVSEAVSGTTGTLRVLVQTVESNSGLLPLLAVGRFPVIAVS